MTLIPTTLLLACIAFPLAPVRGTWQEPERQPVPTSKELSGSKATIRAAMAKDFELERGGVSHKRQLARTLLETAAHTEDIQDRYALYVEASEVASAAGSVRMLDEALASIAREFDVDRWERLVRAAGDVEISHSWQEADNAEGLLELAREALGSNQQKVALELLSRAVKAGKASNYKPLAELCEQEQRRVQQAISPTYSSGPRLIVSRSSIRAGNCGREDGPGLALGSTGSEQPVGERTPSDCAVPQRRWTDFDR